MAPPTMAPPTCVLGVLLLCVLSGAVAMEISSVNVDCDLYMPKTDECADMCPEKCPNKTQRLYIQGFVPANNEEFRSENIVPAAFAAIDEINANCSILPDYELVLEFVDTKCDPSEATWQLINSIVLQDEPNNITKIMFFGGGCSLATEPLAALAGRFYKIPMLSYGASSPALSDNNMFPMFFRTLPSETQANGARIALMNRYNWTKVATLHETEAIFTSSADNFHEQYDEYIKYRNSTGSDGQERELILRSFTDNPDIPLQQIMQEDIRIIIGYYYENKAVETLCKAFRENLHTNKQLWMYIAWYDSNWWKDLERQTNCSLKELKEAVNNSFFFDSYNEAEDPSAPTDTASASLNEFKDKYRCYLEEFMSNPQSMNLSATRETHPYYTYTYDAVYTMARALDNTQRELDAGNSNLSLHDFKYFDNRTERIPLLIAKHLQATNFAGVSGRVVFDSDGTRISQNAIYQLRLNDSDGNDVALDLLAIHTPYVDISNTSNLVPNYNFTYMKEPVFKGGNPPADRSMPVDKYTEPALIYVMDVFIAIALIICLGLLVFNIVTYTKPLIRDSAPLINIIIICGCMVMLVTSFLLGIDSRTPDITDRSTNEKNLRYGIICNLRLWLFTIGFSLSFGALFAKTWQVYRVYTNQNLKKEDLKLWRFFIILGVFLLVDVAYLSFWTGVDQFRLRRETNISSQDSGSADPQRFEMCTCDNFGYLIGALYVYKGLLVVFGLFLAYESRNVKYMKINDSRFVSIAMYIVVIVIGIGAPLSLVLALHNFVDPAYGLSVAMIITSTLSCLLIIHIPKFVYMAQGKDTMVQENMKEEITESSGLQLGTAVDTTTIKTVESEVADLRAKNQERDIELRELQEEGGIEIQVKPRNGSDNDSGVLVTGDETETFSSENDENQNRPNTATPTDVEAGASGSTL